jgi:hypothetical protein
MQPSSGSVPDFRQAVEVLYKVRAAAVCMYTSPHSVTRYAVSPSSPRNMRRWRRISHPPIRFLRILPPPFLKDIVGSVEPFVSGHVCIYRRFAVAYKFGISLRFFQITSREITTQGRKNRTEEEIETVQTDISAIST